MMKSMGKTDMKCTCKPLHAIAGVVLLAAGAFLLVRGFLYQGAAPALWQNWYALGYCALGFLVGGFGKMLKKMSHGCCAMHGGCMCGGMVCK